ncbi:flavoprotein [[Bacillus] enclensis]|uniref:flavoprotein n=1 Tax=[Bacillus] enclensis TaxID=1402860 RepID=UPI0018DE6AC7|nr:flavoprotein [[Bacillus] enclensis]
MILNNFKENGKLLVGVAGAVNAANVPSYLAYIRQNICRNIKVILTKNATKFLTQGAISSVTGDRAFLDDAGSKEFPAPHISLTRWADAFIVLPASANIISKAAHGIADDLLSTAILSSPHSVIFYPNVNVQMWEKKVMQKNIQILKEDHLILYKTDKVLEVASGETELSIIPSCLPDLNTIRKDLYVALNNSGG